METPTCIYDELFSLEEEDAKGAIDDLFKMIYDFSMRHYGRFVSSSDATRLKMVSERGNHGLRMAFLLFIITHETAIRTNVCESAFRRIEEEGGGDTSTDQCWIDSLRERSREELSSLGDGSHLGVHPVGSPTRAFERVCKVVGFYRAMSIGVRSILETQFTEVNAPVLVDRFLQFLFLCWKCTDSEAMHNLCDTFGCRKRIPGTGVFAHWARDPLWDGDGWSRSTSRYDLVTDEGRLRDLCGTGKSHPLGVGGGGDAGGITEDRSSQSVTLFDFITESRQDSLLSRCTSADFDYPTIASTSPPPTSSTSSPRSSFLLSSFVPPTNSYGFEEYMCNHT